MDEASSSQRDARGTPLYPTTGNIQYMYTFSQFFFFFSSSSFFRTSRFISHLLEDPRSATLIRALLCVKICSQHPAAARRQSEPVLASIREESIQPGDASGPPRCSENFDRNFLLILGRKFLSPSKILFSIAKYLLCESRSVSVRASRGV